eukprot:GHRR01018456.1.p1 GENE.GHRR01018456.1~~GHRR01018456.1.p1  ORF type:complete len:705 (+),score=270.54 GHRR01018456.1:300-2117(+)
MKAAHDYNAVPEHRDSTPGVPAASEATPTAAATQASSIKRHHNRSRSSAAELQPLSVGGSSSAGGNSNGGGSSGEPSSGSGGTRELSKSSSLSTKSSRTLAHSRSLNSSGGSSRRASSLLGRSFKQTSSDNKLSAMYSIKQAMTTGLMAGDISTKDDKPFLPTDIHLGAPGTSCSSSLGCSSPRFRPATNSIAVETNSSINSTSNESVSGSSCNVAGHDHDAGGCLAGCCAPSFAAGLLVALLYRGRYPEEFKSQWSLCPRLQTLGFAEGHTICSQLQAVKLALNAGAYQPLESASAAVAMAVLGDWFEGFSCESLTESALGLLVDEADDLLAASLAAAGGQEGQNAGKHRHHHYHKAPHVCFLSQAGTVGAAAQGSATSKAMDDAAAARKASARAVCCVLAAYEQDLFLLLAAVLRHTRHASLDDTRLYSTKPSGQTTAIGSHGNSQGLTSYANNCVSSGDNAQNTGPVAGTAGSNSAAAPGLANSRLTGHLHQQQASQLITGARDSALDFLSEAAAVLTPRHTQANQAIVAATAGGQASVMSQQQQLLIDQQLVDEEVEGAMSALYWVMASWLLGPLAAACGPALDAVRNFLQYLTIDDEGYR